MKTCMKGFVLVASLAMGGCNIFGPPEAAVLEGTWQAVFDEPGDLADAVVLLTFDANGSLVQITAETAAGGTASLDVDEATTTVVDGDQVTISIPSVAGARIFEGTLSEDQNTIDGSLSHELELPSGDLDLTLPGSDLTLTRLAE